MRKLLTTAAAVLVLGATACGDDDTDEVDATEVEAPTRAMPCGADEVYVWIDYEADEAECVASEDHERHAGR